MARPLADCYLSVSNLSVFCLSLPLSFWFSSSLGFALPLLYFFILLLISIIANGFFSECDSIFPFCRDSLLLSLFFFCSFVGICLLPFQQSVCLFPNHHVFFFFYAYCHSIILFLLQPFFTIFDLWSDSKKDWDNEITELCQRSSIGASPVPSCTSTVLTVWSTVLPSTRYSSIHDRYTIAS